MIPMLFPYCASSALVYTAIYMYNIYNYTLFLIVLALQSRLKCCMEVCTTHMFYIKNYEKMISVHLNFINMFTKYVYLKYELTLTHNIQQ